mmetsp:Transcript_125387/g.401557  ORF Transcript_125387/g.401557 Transcript_125387/m.401557 type:complete len:250 (+) Transcript_125387:123-872(+)
MAGLAQLHMALGQKGIRRVIFVRHANAVRPDLPLPDEDRAMLGGPDAYATPHEWKRDDQKRPVTEKGKEQATAARSWWLGYPMRVEEKRTALVASGARRATETLQIMTERDTCVSILMCPSLHPAGIAPTMENMFSTMGYGPLQKFLEPPEGAGAIAEYSELVVAELANVVEGLGAGEDTLAVFGHAVFLNAVAAYLVGAVPGQAPLPEAAWISLPSEQVEVLLTADLGEAEGLLLEPSTGFLHMHVEG